MRRDVLNEFIHRQKIINQSWQNPVVIVLHPHYWVHLVKECVSNSTGEVDSHKSTFKGIPVYTDFSLKQSEIRLVFGETHSIFDRNVEQG